MSGVNPHHPLSFTKGEASKTARHGKHARAQPIALPPLSLLKGERAEVRGCRT
jgi:hypothetical protein